MATGIAQKSCTALFPLWSLRKNVEKIDKYIISKSILILIILNSKGFLFNRSYRCLLQFHLIS